MLLGRLTGHRIIGGRCAIRRDPPRSAAISTAPPVRGSGLANPRHPSRKSMFSAGLDGPAPRQSPYGGAPAEALGAKLLRVKYDDEDYVIIMRDPGGNEFHLA